ncbi:MAG: ABC transporter ATP-binding protein/permease, partial [Deltaproteobacteria bacterium]|nr:ABC transporter ATP-binding protein/permease [Deltaproteobacteria bacterium]
MQEDHTHQPEGLEEEAKPTAPVPSLGALLSLITPQFKKHRLRLAIGFIALVSVDFLQLMIPRILKHGVDALSVGNATPELLFKLGAGIVAIAIFVVGFRFVWRTLIIGFSRYLERALRNRIFNHILVMDQPFFEKRSIGDIMAHASNDLAAVQLACGMGMVAAVDALVLAIAAIGFMIHIHPMLTLMALLPMPILAISTRLLSSKLHHRFNTVQERFSLIMEFARSALVSIKLSKAYTLEAIQTREFNRLGKNYARANIEVAMVQGVLFPAATLIGNLGLLAILLFGGKLVVNKIITMGDFVAFITYLQMLIWPMMAVGWVANLLQRGLTAMRRVHSLISSEPLLLDRPSSPHIAMLQPTISVNQLSFTYPSSSQPDLEDISFSVASGIIGIAGRTGSGKSTLCKLLVRLYPVPDNTVFFGDRDVNHLSLVSVRSQIGYVSQEPVLFSDTMSANIAFGREDASTEEIEQAARDADIHKDISAFSSAYNTIIGERGVTLSGGQRQRVALARALICNRPVLVIDDGLSAVDTETESKILEVLRSRLKGRTVFIVSN